MFHNLQAKQRYFGGRCGLWKVRNLIRKEITEPTHKIDGEIFRDGHLEVNIFPDVWHVLELWDDHN